METNGKYGGVIGFFFDLIENVTRMVDKYGLYKMIKALFFIAMIYQCFMFRSQEYKQSIAEASQTVQTDVHSFGSEVRSNVSAKVNTKLVKMTHAMASDRAFILEMHNGKENPTNLPFNYCDMTYEEINEELCHTYINDDFDNINMGKYVFPEYLYRNGYFIGTIDELKEIDKKLVYRLCDDNVKFLAMILVKSDIEIGFLGVTFSEIPENVSREEMYGKLAMYAQEIAYLLDFDKQKKVYNGQRRNRKQ